MRTNPRFYPARKNLAINEFDMKHFAEEELQFNRVLKDAPADEITHVYLGEVSFARTANCSKDRSPGCLLLVSRIPARRVLILLDSVQVQSL